MVGSGKKFNNKDGSVFRIFTETQKLFTVKATILPEPLSKHLVFGNKTNSVPSIFIFYLTIPYAC